MEATIQLPLSQGYVAVIDAADFERELTCGFRTGFVWTGRIAGRKWSLQKSRKCNYAYVILANDAMLYLHRAVFCATADQLIDHEDGDGLNCRRYNLGEGYRVCQGRRGRLHDGERLAAGALFSVGVSDREEGRVKHGRRRVRNHRARAAPANASPENTSGPTRRNIAAGNGGSSLGACSAASSTGSTRR